jgi:hypothetical protein
MKNCKRGNIKSILPHLQFIHPRGFDAVQRAKKLKTQVIKSILPLKRYFNPEALTRPKYEISVLNDYRPERPECYSPVERSEAWGTIVKDIES